MAFFTKSGGIWRTIQNLWVKQSGSWRQVQNGWIKQGGVWRQFYSAIALPSVLEVFIVGAGGRGQGTGGGGGGGVRGWTSYIPAVQSFPIVVGTQGAGTVVGTSSININGTLVSASGGFNSSGTTGGAQGGPNSRPGGTGNVASNRNWCCGAITYGGGGGGHSSNGTNVTTGVNGPCGGRASLTWYWGGCGGAGFALDTNTSAVLTTVAGTPQTAVGSGGGGTSTGGSCSTRRGSSCPGGPGGTGAGNGGTGPSGTGSSATMYGCGGGGLGGLGRGGVVIVRYSGNVRLANGGTVIYRAADNKTYHVFTASGTLAF